MSYYEELLKGSVFSIGERFPRDGSLLIVACADVEKLRTSNAALEAETRALREEVEVWQASSKNNFASKIESECRLNREIDELRKDSARLIWFVKFIGDKESGLSLKRAMEVNWNTPAAQSNLDLIRAEIDKALAPKEGNAP